MKLLETLDEEKKEYLVHLKLLLPWPVDNRSCLVTYSADMDGMAKNIQTSEGNERYLDKYRHLLGKDEIMMQQSYIALKPNPNGQRGFTGWKVIYFDMKGVVPNWLVNKVTKGSFNDWEKSLEYCRKHG